ncbi:glutaredoxin [Russula emetica]|nr:glutaredoxin [Russula emetica]
MSTPKEFVDKAVAENTVVVFSKSWCPYSKKAKALLKDKYSDAQTAIFELDEREDGAEVQNYLQEKTGQRTVPNVFIKQKHIGGSDTLATLDSEGGIRALLN